MCFSCLCCTDGKLGNKTLMPGLLLVTRVSIESELPMELEMVWVMFLSFVLFPKKY